MTYGGVTVSVPIGDRVIGIHRTTGRDAIRAARDMAGRRRRGRHRGLGRQAGRGVAVDEPAEAGRQRRQGCTVDLSLVIRRDDQRRRGDRQRARDIADAVV